MKLPFLPMRILLFLLLCLSLAACQTRSTKQTEENKAAYSLKATGTKTWKAASLPYGRPIYVDYYTRNGEEYLLWESRDKVAVDFYAWNSDSLSFRISPTLNSLKEKCHMRGYFVASPDSVYILNPMDYEIYLLNRKGDLLRTFSWSKYEQKFGHIDQSMPGIYAGSPAIRQGNWLHMFCVPETDSRDRRTYSEGRTNLSLNLKSGEARYGYGYPSRYETGSFGHYKIDIFRCRTPDDKILYSFGADDSVRLTDYKRHEQAFYAGSRFMSTPPEVPDSLRSKTSTPSYKGIFYDKQKEVYYRLAVKSWAKGELSVIILDKNFHKVGETKLPTGLHSPAQAFVGPDGFYLSNHGPEYKNSQHLSFTRYELASLN